MHTNMFRRSAATQDARSNSLLSLPSTITSTNNLSATSNATDEEAHLQDNTANEKPTTSKKKLNPFSKGQKQQRIVPTRKATPDQIRAYFTKLLTEHDALLADDAAKCESIVSAWKIGGGVEMRQYGPAMYLELFGREYGWILYREVRMSIRKETNFLVRRPLCTCVDLAIVPSNPSVPFPPPLLTPRLTPSPPRVSWFSS